MFNVALRRRPGTVTSDPLLHTAGNPNPTAKSKSTSVSLSSNREVLDRQPQPQPRPTFQSLPQEIHLLISKNLIYPDALSLKHTSRYFYGLVDTGVRLKVEWLMERRKLHLECPSNQRCDLGSDLRFCRGSVQLLMQRRREHIECESRPGLGCLIYGTRTCPHSKKLKTKLKRWLRQPVIEIKLRWAMLIPLFTLACYSMVPILAHGSSWVLTGFAAFGLILNTVVLAMMVLNCYQLS